MSQLSPSNNASSVLDFLDEGVLIQNPSRLPKKLMDTREPPESYQREKPWHRTAAYLASSGFDQRQIAEATGKTPGAVSLLAKQLWWQTLVAQIIETRDVGKAAADMLRAAVPSAIFQVVHLSSNGDSDAIKLRACQDILDRALGKAPARVEHVSSQMDPIEEVHHLEQEIARHLNNNKAQPAEIAAVDLTLLD